MPDAGSSNEAVVAEIKESKVLSKHFSLTTEVIYTGPVTISIVGTCHPTLFNYRPIENIFEVVQFWELVPVVFTGLRVWGIDPVINRGGMVSSVSGVLLDKT
eukprot:140638-Amphidinium_carterae.1